MDLPADRRTGMAVEEALRGHDELLGLTGVRRHPGLAGRQSRIRGIADTDEAEPLRFLERRQSGRPYLAWRERRRMVGAIERHRLADLGGAGDHRPSRIEALMPGLGQFTREFGARAIACRAIGILGHL